MSKKSECDKKVLKEMIGIFYPNDMLKKQVCYDWMGYEINDTNVLTYHHIAKASSLRSEGLSDEATIDNGACLGELSHAALHIIEKLDKEVYDSWNELFILINRSRKPLDEDMMEKIRKLEEASFQVIASEEEKKSGKSK